nr:uncharacterized protein CI109_004908 [Kwoniella shandongensis]KAA5526705.1 hypothetical protein CI109_004908 [Kwoniella shandongensis]
MAQISPLSLSTSTTLRSSFILPTLPQILSELVQNSLDAGATSIACWVDLTKHGETIRVEDDGCGISEEGLKRVGKRFRTSKRLNESGLGPIGCYGFRGEALASIASIALLDITTRTDSSPSTFTKIIKSSKILFRGHSPNRHISSEGGTIITVRDVFHDIPVRREELATSNNATVMMHCKKVVERLSLGWPGVDWSLWEDGREGGAKNVLGIAQNKNRVEVFRALYGNALVQRYQSIRVSSGKRRVDGFISLSGDVSKTHQHLYINNYPVDRGELHLAISKKFAASRFATLASSGKLDEVDDWNARARRSPRRLERHPIYVLNVTLPSSDVDVAYEPRKGLLGYKDLDSVKALLLAVVDEYLRRNDFGPLRARSTTPSPTKISQPSQTAPYLPSPLTTPRTPRFTLALQSSNLPPSPLRPTFRGESLPPAIASDQGDDNCLVHEGTAVPIPNRDEPASKRQRTDSEVYSQCRLGSRPVRKHQWIFDLAGNLDTGVLPTTPRLVSMPEEGSSVLNDVDSEHCRKANEPRRAISLQQPIKAIKTDAQFTKTSLSTAQIIGQVDRKYIAAVLRTTSASSSLVLIDQHAADERVSVETILRELCEGFGSNNVCATKAADGEQMIVLTRAEAEQLSQPAVMGVLRRWGITFKPPDLETEGDYVQVQVEHVPSVLASRLGRKEAAEITRLVRGYLPVLMERMGEVEAMLRSVDGDALPNMEDGIDGRNGLVQQEEERHCGDWGRAMRFMPKEMLELANSKACRV